MAETTVTTDVHQTLDVHRRLATQVTFDGEQSDLITDLFEISVSQILDFFGIRNVTCLANFASTGATDAKIAVKPISACCWGGMLIPAIRAICVL